MGEPDAAASVVYVVKNSNRDVSCIHSDAESAERCRLVKNAAYPTYVVSAWDFRGYQVEPTTLCGGPFAQAPTAQPKDHEPAENGPSAKESDGAT